jgi:hypothetical protein
MTKTDALAYVKYASKAVATFVVSVVTIMVTGWAKNNEPLPQTPKGWAALLFASCAAAITVYHAPANGPNPKAVTGSHAQPG